MYQGNDIIVICCVYVPLGSPLSYVSSLVHFLTELTSSFTKCIVVGDFNFSDIDLSVLMGTSNPSNCFCVTLFAIAIYPSMFLSPPMLKEMC